MVSPHQPYPQSSLSSSGTSKIVPVVVSAGLAVGVFAGLLFGLGTGEVAANSGKRTGTGGTELAAFDVGTEEYEGSGKVAVATPDGGVPDGGVPSAIPDGGTPAADAGSGVDAGSGSAAPAIKLAHIAFVVTPPGVTARITVDGKPVEGDAEIDISAGAKNVEVVARAAGFRDFRKKISIGKDESLTIDLVKRPVGGTPSNGSSGKRNDGKIDI